MRKYNRAGDTPLPKMKLQISRSNSLWRYQLDVRVRSGGELPPNGASEHGADHKVLKVGKSTTILGVRCKLMNPSDSRTFGVETGGNLEESKRLPEVSGVL
jgi:hypothetical protein